MVLVVEVVIGVHNEKSRIASKNYFHGGIETLPLSIIQACKLVAHTI
jgi:hypothetical protein